ncbi:MAG: hypothetical protein ACI84C_002218 [Flavobacteriales bacterium]|jgi:hypothetical protein
MRRIIKPQALVLFAIALVLVIANLAFVDQKEASTFHSWEELMQIRGGSSIDLPQGTNSLFTGSGRCAGCHGHDPNLNAGYTAEGVDVNLVDDWRATMMANAAKDPFWRAKVSHEVAVNPQHQDILEDKCTSCHASQGHFAAHFDGDEFYSIAEMTLDSLALDGVSCSSCHQQREEGIGQSFSGELVFDNDTIYGPYGNDPDEDPIFEQPMQSFVGYTPVYGGHIGESELCAGCHTLVTNTVDLEGEPTGGTFTEQATYHEWVNSVYNNEQNDGECQSCHLPQLDEPIVISANYAFLPGREPYGQHFLTGANSFMLEVLKENIPELGIWATEEQFDVAIERTISQLQNQSVTIELSELGVDIDSAYYELKLTNLAGHKFPSGYPSRRAYIEFLALEEDGDTLFSSGVLQSNYEVNGQNGTYEPHYDLITDEEQVQIYEMVMADVNGDVTTVLERADVPIKDNRLVPLGFSSDHYNYDTTLVAGLALNDPNFNFEGAEGSGTDRIEYHFPLEDYAGTISIKARLWYQTAPPKWNDEMFAYSTPEIEAFEEMYWEVGPAPVMVDEEVTTMVIVHADEVVLDSNPSIYPNPTSDSVNIDARGDMIELIQVYNASGLLVQESRPNSVGTRLKLNVGQGIYFLRIKTTNGVHLTEVVKL